MRALAGVLGLSCVLAACGGSAGASSARDAAATYVEAVKAQDWQRACSVSVGGEEENCPELLATVYADPESVTPAPAVSEALKVVERSGDRYFVHFEYQIIR